MIIQCSMEINEDVEVQLTGYGMEIYNLYHQDAEAVVRHDVAKALLRESGSGWYKFQLWELMLIFGSVMHQGNPRVPFEKVRFTLP